MNSTAKNNPSFLFEFIVERLFVSEIQCVNVFEIKLNSLNICNNFLEHTLLKTVCNMTIDRCTSKEIFELSEQIYYVETCSLYWRLATNSLPIHNYWFVRVRDVI